MRHWTFLLWLVAALTSALIMGCRTSSGRLHYPEDPLLAHKPPLEGKAHDSGPVLLAHAEPAMPGLPAEVLAARTPPARMPLAEQPAMVPAIPTSRELSTDTGSSGKGPLEAIPAVRQKNPPRD
jgi:hypothetical protein